MSLFKWKLGTQEKVNCANCDKVAARVNDALCFKSLQRWNIPANLQLLQKMNNSVAKPAVALESFQNVSSFMCMQRDSKTHRKNKPIKQSL